MQLNRFSVSWLVAILIPFGAWMPAAQASTGPSSDLLLVLDADGQGYSAQHTLMSDGTLMTLELPPERTPLLTRFSGPETLTFTTAHEQNPDRIALWSGAAMTRYRHASGNDFQPLEGGSGFTHTIDTQAQLDVDDVSELNSTVTWVLPDNASLLSFDDAARPKAENTEPGHWQINGNTLSYAQNSGPLRILSISLDLSAAEAMVSDPCLGIAAPTDACAPDTDSDGVPDYRDICLPDAEVAASESVRATTGSSSYDELGCNQATVVTLTGVQFQSGQSYLDVASRDVLDRVALALQRQSDQLFEVSSHTDNGGGLAHNQRLSENRADAVRHYLMLRGVGPNQLNAQGYGEISPSYDNSTVAGRRANRRVELRRLN